MTTFGLLQAVVSIVGQDDKIKCITAGQRRIVYSYESRCTSLPCPLRVRQVVLSSSDSCTTRCRLS